MIFNSLIFLVFLAFTLAFYYKLPFKAQNLFLLGASYLFYGWWDWRFLFLLIFTSGFDFLCALAIEKQSDRRKRRWLLIFSLVLNMACCASSSISISSPTGWRWCCRRSA